MQIDFFFFITIFLQFLCWETFKGPLLWSWKEIVILINMYLYKACPKIQVHFISDQTLCSSVEGCKKLTTFWLTAQSSTRVITIMIIMKLKCFSNISLGTVLSSPKKGGHCEKIALLMLSSSFFKVCQKEWLQKSLKQHTEWGKKFNRHWLKMILSF